MRAELASGHSGIFLADGGSIVSIADTTGLYEGFSGLLGLGDPLFGSVVADFALNPVSLNDRDQVALRVGLADGSQFILRADRRG